MKTLRAFLLVIGIALVSLTLPSCLDDDNSYSLGDIWIAVATVVPEGNNVYYLRLDDGDKLWPAATIRTISRSLTNVPWLTSRYWRIPPKVT